MRKVLVDLVYTSTYTVEVEIEEHFYGKHLKRRVDSILNDIGHEYFGESNYQGFVIEKYGDGI